MILVMLRIEGFDLPGRTCGPGPDHPDGHHNVHIAVQSRKGQQDLLGLVPADVASTVRELSCDVVTPPPASICAARKFRARQEGGLPTSHGVT
jgi:hypothetical protein